MPPAAHANAANVEATAPQRSATSTPAKTPEAKPAKVGWIEGILRRELAVGGFAWGSAAHLRIYKQENVLEIWLRKGARYEKFKDFKICKWSGKLGPKFQEGDKQSPEGVYTVTRGQLLSRTKNHRAISLNFPNAYDRRMNRTGSFLQLHGGCGSVGCYAMTDRGIEEIYRILDAAFDAGQQRVSVHIFPFHLTDERLAAQRTHKAFAFWTMLKPIYASFKATQTLPGVRVCGSRYLAPGDSSRPLEKCVPVWQQPASNAGRLLAGKTGSGKAMAKARQQPAARRILVKCNLRLPSCKRWLAIQRRKLARRGIRTGGIRQGGKSYVRKAAAGGGRASSTRLVRNIARERRRRALRQ